jgi:hypothetical protein
MTKQSLGYSSWTLKCKKRESIVIGKDNAYEGFTI